MQTLSKQIDPSGKVLVVASCLVFAACATPDLKPPTSALATAAETAQASLKDYGGTLDAAVRQANAVYASENRASLRQQSNDCVIRAVACRLVLKSSDGKETPFVPDRIDANIQELMGGVVRYAKNLEKIAAADFASEVKTGAQALKTNVIGLAEAVDKLKGTGTATKAKVSAFADPTADALTWLLGRYLEHMKLSALRDATKDMDAIMPDLTDVFSQEAKKAIEVRRSDLGIAFNNARLVYATKDKPTLADVAAYADSAAAYNASLELDPTLVFKKFAAAHAALKNSLNRESLSFDEVFAEINALAAEAEKLVGISKSFVKAAGG